MSLRHPASIASRSLFLFLTACLVLAADSASSQEVRVDLDVGEVRAVGDPGAVRFVAAETRPLSDFGRPQLPVLHYRILVPRDASVRSARIEGGEVRSLGVWEGLARDEGHESTDGRLVREVAFEPGEGDGFGLYPPVEVRLGADGYRHGYHLVSVEIYPVRRVEATGEILARVGGTVVLDLGPRQRAVQIADRQRHEPRWRASVEERLASEVRNPEALRGYDLPRTMPTATEVPVAVSKTPSLASSPVEVLIITNEAMRPEFQRLADHRTKLGDPALVVTLEEILANYRHGLDLSETIRKYIIDAYTKWGTDYVLLGGDAEVIPPRYASSTFYPPGGQTYVPADLYYSCLDGNWNDDGDAIFGEPFINSIDVGDFVDFDPELSVGRATVQTLTEAQVFVDKVLEYEIPQNVGYQSSILFASEVLFPQDWQPGDGIQLDGAVFSEEINDSLTCDQYGSWTSYRSYQNYTAYPGSVPETKADVLAQLNSGNYGVFNHIGHGFYFNMSVGDNNIVVADADGLINGPNYFVLYALNCSSGAFDFNCLMERFLLNPTGGSVASIGSSRAAFPNASNKYQQDFYRAWLCKQLPRLGDIMNDSRVAYTGNTFWNTSDRWTHLCYSLLGDPSMRVWATRPRDVTISAPASAVLGPNSLLVNVTDTALATPYEGVTVCLTKDGEDYAVGVTDAAGNVTLGFGPETLGDVTVWVSGAGAMPESVTIPVMDPAAAYLSVESFSLLDDGTAGSIGNGNGRPEGGERIALSPLVRNGGTVAFPGGTLTLSTGDPYLTVFDAGAAIGAIGADGSLLASDPFLLDVGVATPDGHEAQLEILATNGGGPGSWTDTEILMFQAAELEVLRVDFDDSVYGNGDGIITFGEDIVVLVDLKNFGAGGVNGVTGVLATSSPDATIIDGSSAWGAMPDPLSVADNSADAFVIEELDVVTPQIYNLTLTDDQGRVRMTVFDLHRPNQPFGVSPGVGGAGEVIVNWEPGADADLLGYRVYRRPNDGVSPFTPASADIIVGSSTYRDTGLPPLTSFEFFVRAVDSGKLEGPASDTVIASTAPAEISCFPLPLGLETSSSLAVGHVDLDGVPDMVIGADHVYVIDGDCQEKIDGDNDSQTFGPITTEDLKYTPPSIALGDLDGLAGMEIVACSWGTSTAPDRRTWVLDEMGNVLPGWPVQTMAKNWSTPALGDLDGDGDLEIVINDTGGYTSAFHHDGTEVADGDANPATFGPIAPRRQENGVTEVFGRTSPALYDVDGDGQLEILFGSKYQNNAVVDKFYALKTDGSGTNAPGWPQVLAPKSEFLSSPTIADINNDGTDEIIVLCENDSLYVWRPDGSRVAPFPVPIDANAVNLNSVEPSVAVGDFTGDGNLEMVVMGTLWAGSGTRCYLMDHQANVFPGWPFDVENISEASPVVGDINGDGQLDVVFGVGGAEGDKPNYLYAFNMDGSSVEGFPIFLGGFARATPTLTDFNQDGNVNIVLASWDKLIHVWDMASPYDPALMPWPTFRGNVHRDGVFTTEITTSAPQPTTVSVRPVLAPNVPNPFNPSTRIRFEIPGTAPVSARLAIFDAGGRHVITLRNETMQPGPYEVVWQGQDETGGRVSSGVYYARLDVAGQPSLARKMVMVK